MTQILDPQEVINIEVKWTIDIHNHYYIYTTDSMPTVVNIGKSLSYPLTYETSATSPPNVSNRLKHPLTYVKPVKTPPGVVLKAGFCLVSGFVVAIRACGQFARVQRTTRRRAPLRSRPSLLRSLVTTLLSTITSSPRPGHLHVVSLLSYTTSLSQLAAARLLAAF
jgi:hypothetical protein